MTTAQPIPDVSREPNAEELKLLGADTEQGLIHRILSSLGLLLKVTKRATTGNNTTTFILTCTSTSDTAKASNLNIKLAGTDPLPDLTDGEEIKVVFSTSKVREDLNAVLMVENRVAAMKLVREGGKVERELIPRVWGWSDGKGEGEVDGQTWCLMEFLQGVPLSSLWETMTLQQKLNIVPSVAKIFQQLQSTPTPDTPTPYGAFSFIDPSSRSSSVTTTESCFYYGGPYATAQELYKGYMITQFRALKKVKQINGWKGYGEVRIGSGEVIDLEEALKKFEKVVNGDVAGWDKLVEDLPEAKPVFIHGDFDILNILVDPETLEITAVLDFEFAQCGPPLDEYFQSLPTFGLLTLGSRYPATITLPPSETTPESQEELSEWYALDPIIHNLSPGTTSPDEPERNTLARKTVEELIKLGAVGPWSYDKKEVDNQANLYWFQYEVCQGWMQRSEIWKREGEEWLKRRDEMIKGVARGLVADLERWL